MSPLRTPCRSTHRLISRPASLSAWLAAPFAAKMLILMAPLISLPALADALTTNQKLLGNTVTVSVTLTGKDATGKAFSTVRSLDIPFSGTPDKLAVNATLNIDETTSSSNAETAFSIDRSSHQFKPHTANTIQLPELAATPAPSTLRIQPSASGMTMTNHDATSRFTVNTETARHTGISIGVQGALLFGDNAAFGGGVQMGRNSSELFANLGLNLSATQQLMFTGGQLRQNLEYAFPSGTSKTELTQNSAGAAWRFKLGSGLFEFAEASAYAARTNSRDLSDLTYAVDSATLFELWNDPRRIAGGSIAGLQGKLGLRPWESGRFNVSVGQEKLQYDLQNGSERYRRATGSINLEQAIGTQTQLKFGVDIAAAQNRFSAGIKHHFAGFGALGIDFTNIRGRDHTPNDNRVQLSWNTPLGTTTSSTASINAPRPSTAETSATTRPLPPEVPRPSQSNAGLLDQVATRPSWMPSQVIAKIDTSAGPTRLIAIDKTALPAGASVNISTGAISIPLGILVAGIAAVSKNGAAFVNAGQFSLFNNSLVVNPNQITQPAVGVLDTYVVTINAAGGGTVLVTINISHGSVKIDSIRLVTPSAPTASAVAISGTAQVGQVLTGNYSYADVDGDAQGISTFRWLRNGIAIAGATASTYTLVAADQSKTISLEVTPVATVAPTTGTPVISASTAAVAGTGATVAPTASAVAISGTVQIGQILTGTYSYADINNDPQGISTFRWLRNGVAIAGATASAYTLLAADLSTTIRFEVTPVATVAPTTGAPVASAPTAAVVAAGTPMAPSASAVSITGTAQTGETLTGSYNYADINGDLQGVSTFRWLRNSVAIAGATATTYTLQAEDLGAAIRFEVTPVATVAPTAGTPVVSAATALIVAFGAPAAPVASAVVISGTAQVGQMLIGYYSYTDANNDPQGVSTFRWRRNGVGITGATASTYTPVAADQGTAISFEVTPVATAAPTTGTPAVSPATALALGLGAPATPTASALAIAGFVNVGEVLTGSYSYADANNDPQGVSSFRWLRNGVAIAGATATAYTLVATDQGKSITFEVTPVSTVAPTTGTPAIVQIVSVGVADTAPTVAPPAVTNIGATSLTLSNQIADVDGVRNITYFLYSNAAGTALVAANGSGSFTGLLTAASYWVKTSAETKNVVTGVWTLQTSTFTATGTDGTAPVTTGAPQVSNTTNISTVLSAQINENGTGYYLVIADELTPPPSSATMLDTGTPFTMSANTLSKVTISGLLTGNLYRIYFVAKDAGNTVQAAVQRVDVTTKAFLPAGYIYQGDLIWMPITSSSNWSSAAGTCAGTINGQTGWRMPTRDELKNLYSSGAMNGQGWTLDVTWSSTSYNVSNNYTIDLSFNAYENARGLGYASLVSCVR